MIQKTYHTHRETIHNFIWRSLQTFGKQGITFLIFIICAKILTPYEFGIYNYALAIIFFLIMFGDFGISTATSKYVAEYNATDKNKLKSVLFNSGIIILALTIIITILTLIIGPWYLKEKYIYVLWLLPLIFLAPMTSLYDGIYRGLKRFKQLAIISLIVGIFSLSFVYILIKNYGLLGALIAQNLFYLILFLALAFGYREFHFKWNREVMRKITSYAIVVGIATLGYYFYSQINTLILGNKNYILEIAYYEIINKIFLILIIPFTILGQVLAPNNSISYGKGRKEEIRLKFISYIKIFFFIGVLLSLFVYFTIPYLINYFFNKYSLDILYNIMNIQIFVFFILISTATINNGIITPTNYNKYITLSTIIIGFINLLLALYLETIFQYKGILYAGLISYILNTTSIYLIYYKTTFNRK